VLDAGRFTEALLARIEDPELVGRPPVGTVDQFLDNTDALENITLARNASSTVDRLRPG
jgi:hypothetical protein